MPKLELANGLWIGVAPTILRKLTMVEETLIAHYHYWMVLFKLRYTNKGGITCQRAFKGNVVSFAQNSNHAIELLNKLPLPLKSISNFIVVHFVGSTHPPIELVKSCNFLYVHEHIITTWFHG
jgi:hypothetical protein